MSESEKIAKKIIKRLQRLGVHGVVNTMDGVAVVELEDVIDAIADVLEREGCV